MCVYVSVRSRVYARPPSPPTPLSLSHVHTRARAHKLTHRHNQAAMECNDTIILKHKLSALINISKSTSAGTIYIYIYPPALPLSPGKK